MIARHASSSLRWGACCLWLLCTAEARAQPLLSPVSLDYEAVPACPSAAEFQAMIVARLSYDPFSEDAQKHVAVRITAQGTTLDGHTEWRAAGGKWAGDQSFHQASTDCLRLARTMGLALAVQLQLLADPHSDPKPTAVASAEPPPAPPASAAAPPPKPAHAEERASASGTPPPPVPTKTASRTDAPTFALGAGASVGLGMSTAPIFLGRAFGRLDWPRLSLQLGPELSVPASTRRADGAGFSQQLQMVSAAACWVLGRFRSCLVLNAGQVRMSGQDIDRPYSARVPIVEAGVRVAFEQAIGRRVFVDAHLDGLTLLVRRTARLDEVAVWTAPPLAAALGLEAGLRFP